MVIQNRDIFLKNTWCISIGMPSICSSNSTMAMDSANKTSLIKATLLRAWRERWDDAQWGTYIKSVGQGGK